MEKQPLQPGGRRMMRLGTYFMAAMVAALVAGCGIVDDDTVLFDGQLFRGDAKKNGDLSQFRATAGPVSASLAGAREAVRYEGTRYCIENFGSSAIDWVVDPDAPVEDLPISGNKITLEGTCPR